MTMPFQKAYIFIKGRKSLSNNIDDMNYIKPNIKILDSSTHRHLMDTIWWGGTAAPEEGDAKRGFWEEEPESNITFNVWQQE